MPYHATLTPGQADSVPGDPASWWRWLNEWPGPAPEYPRGITALIASDPAAVYMFVLSKNYLRACGDDITAGAEHVADPDRLFIVSAGARLQGDLAAFAVPADARLQAQFSGTRRALNARIGLHLLAAGIRGRSEATANLTQLLAAQPPIPRYDRKKQTDGEILDLIAQRLAQTPTTSANRLLREFRDAGLACEQHRFTRLFRTAAEATS